MKKNPALSNGFTLVEVMIAVMIIALLAAMATPAVIKSRDRAQRNVCRSNLRVLDQAAQAHVFEHGISPDMTLETLLPYLAREKLPLCPGRGTYSLSVSPEIKVTCSIPSHNL